MDGWDVVPLMESIAASTASAPALRSERRSDDDTHTTQGVNAMQHICTTSPTRLLLYRRAVMERD
jgi:hypothetical protein